MRRFFVQWLQVYVTGASPFSELCVWMLNVCVMCCHVCIVCVVCVRCCQYAFPEVSDLFDKCCDVFALYCMAVLSYRACLGFVSTCVARPPCVRLVRVPLLL